MIDVVIFLIAVVVVVAVASGGVWVFVFCVFWQLDNFLLYARIFFFQFLVTLLHCVLASLNGVLV